MLRNPVKRNETTASSQTLAPPEPRRQAVQQRGQDRIEAILTATEEALKESGNGSLSVVDIAARAGFTHSLIYHYFKSIEEIVSMMKFAGNIMSRIKLLRTKMRKTRK